MDEDCDAALGQNDVRSTGKTAAAESKSKPCPVEITPHEDLRLGIAAADSGHHPATGFRADDVGHQNRIGRGLAQIRLLFDSRQVSGGKIACIRVLNGATDNATV